MKQGTTFKMPVMIDMELSLVKAIDFLFVQGPTELLVTYPSEKAIKRPDSNRIIDIAWSEEETWLFDSSKRISLDTKIYLNDSDTNPDTKIATFILHKTLFRQEDSDD